MLKSASIQELCKILINTMLKKVLLLLIFITIRTTIVYGQNTQTFTPLQMRQDIDSLVKYLEEAHPNPYYRFSKEKFYKDVQLVKNSLNKNLTIVDFYLVAEPLLGKLDDGHTDFHVMETYNNQNPFVLPYSFKLVTYKPYIICKGAYHTITSQLPAGAEIISINHISAQKIVNDIINLNTGENRAFRAEFGANRFSFYLEALYKANGNYDIKYKNRGIAKNTVIKGIKKDDIDGRLKHYNDTAANNTSSPAENYSLQVIEKDKTAIINFKSFDWDGFTSFADSAFAVIKQKGLQNLIINLIDNGGGDSDVGDDFFQYILNKPFRQYDKVLEKNSELLKERLKEHKVNKTMDSSDFALLAKTNGSFDTVFYRDVAIRENPVRFNANVYLLINLETYSSASDFAQCFKYYKRGMIIGEETGGLIKSYGDIVSAHLPNSQLELTVSSKLYYNIGATETDWHGVVPDKVVPSNMAMTKALEIIRSQK